MILAFLFSVGFVLGQAYLPEKNNPKMKVKPAIDLIISLPRFFNDFLH
jgi:hypothetical protein